MKRDMELVRDILRRTENVGAEDVVPSDSFPDYDQLVVAKHMELLVEAGFLDAALAKADGVGVAFARARRLTWEGHEFWAAAQNDTVWKKAMAYVQREGGAVPIAVLKDALILYAKQRLGLPDS